MYLDWATVEEQPYRTQEPENNVPRQGDC